jgi:hypothetical protein
MLRPRVALQISKRVTAVNSTEAQAREFKKIFTGHCTQLVAVLAIASPVLLRVGFTTSANALPSWQQFLLHFLMWNVVEDTGFYWCV